MLLQTAAAAVSRLPISLAGGGRADVVLKSSVNGSVSTTMYGSHSSPAAAMLLPPSAAAAAGPLDDLYDDDDPAAVAAAARLRDGSYRRPVDDLFLARQLPDLPRIPVDSAGKLPQSFSSAVALRTTV